MVTSPEEGPLVAGIPSGTTVSMARFRAFTDEP
jgi:hypothetical protein